MARGVLSGIVLGAVLSVGVAVVISILVPLQPAVPPETGLAGDIAPAPPLTAEPAPKLTVTRDEGAEAPQPQVTMRTPAASTPPTEPPAAAEPPVIGTIAPQTEAAEVPATTPVPTPQSDGAGPGDTQRPARPVETAQTDPDVTPPARAPQPRTGPAAEMTAPPALPAAPDDARVEADAPVLPNPQALAPMIPDTSTDAPVDTRTAEAPPAEEEEVRVAIEAPAPEAVVVTPLPLEDAADPASDALNPATGSPPAQAADAARQAPDASASAAPPIKPRVLVVPGTPTTQGAGETVTSRPSIGTPASTLLNRAEPTPTEQTDTPEDTPRARDLLPIDRFAARFENPDEKPLMSIVLIDAGVDLEAAEIGLPALSSFPYPVSFAVDASLPDAQARMTRYRAEGFEVLAMVDLPAGARPTDAEVSLNVALSKMSEVVGVLDGIGQGLQADRDVADQVTQILMGSGHGLVAQSKGLDTMPKLAVKLGVPAAPVFRDFDSKGQNARTIRRFLDQAAFKAGQEGGVIALGRLRPETVKALLVWGLADRASSVALAPVSAVLRAKL